MGFSFSPGDCTVFILLHPFTALTVIFQPGAGLQVYEQAVGMGVQRLCLAEAVCLPDDADLRVFKLATRQCNWRDNRNARDTGTKVLSCQEQLFSNFKRPRQIGTELSHDVLNPARVPL